MSVLPSPCLRRVAAPVTSLMVASGGCCLHAKTDTRVRCKTIATCLTLRLINADYLLPTMSRFRMTTSPARISISFFCVTYFGALISTW